MTAPSPPRKRFARAVRAMVPIAVLGIILLAVSTVGFIEYSAQPGFCKSCHNMVPYYDSWASSSHNEVACIECHYAPGIKAEAMGKLQAANQVVKYITGSYGMRPWAEIEDAACLRSGCHSERKVEGAIDYNGVQFDHAEHLGELRRGKQLRCTSCHSQIVQGDHVAVTQVTCFLCHFKDRPPGDPIAGCVACHPSPPRVVSGSGYIVDHSRYVADQVSCISCHADVTTGAGSADRGQCFNCHNEPARIDQFDNPPRLHQIHITDHKIECTQCHAPIEHQIASATAVTTAELDCTGCHTKAHSTQVQLYAGTGGHNTEATPSKMFLARVSCVGCHEQTATLRGHEQVQTAGEASCLSCHGVRYSRILPSWKQGMDERVRRVAPIVTQARAVLNAAGPGRRQAADSLLRMAEENLDLVRTGRPAHNVTFADRLLRTSIDLVREAVKVGRLPYIVPTLDLGPPVNEAGCSSCHVGTERAVVPFRGGGTFPHQPHVQRGQMTCVECHTPFDQHGGTKITSSATCQACHHREERPRDCVTCHESRGGTTGPTTVLLADGVSFPHATHQTALPTCVACHTPPSMSAGNIECISCHEQHHETARLCGTCHQSDGLLEKHGGFAAIIHAEAPPCATCHTEAEKIETWSWQTCTTCHVNKAAGHYEESVRSTSTGCETCHDLKTIGSSG